MIFMDCLIVNHHSRFINELISLFSEVIKTDAIDYIDFCPETAEDYDFTILSGGPVHISEPSDLPEEKEFVRRTNKPVLGICLGLEIICVAYGSELKYLDEKKEGFYDFEIFGKKDKLYFAHEWYNDDVPEDFILVSKGNEGIEALYHKTKPILGIEGHPENSGDYGRFIRNKFIEEFVENGY